MSLREKAIVMASCAGTGVVAIATGVASGGSIPVLVGLVAVAYAGVVTVTDIFVDRAPAGTSPKDFVSKLDRRIGTELERSERQLGRAPTEHEIHEAIRRVAEKDAPDVQFGEYLTDEDRLWLREQALRAKPQD